MTGRLVLIRHAKSDYPWGVDDHDRPLNPRGRRDAPRVGVWLTDHVAIDGPAPAVRVSTARRAQATWAAARAAAGGAWGAVVAQDEPDVYEADVATLLAVAADAAAVSDLVVLVGHNPGLADLVEHLAVDDDLRRAALARFATSAIAVLDAGEQPLAAALAGRGTMRVTAYAVPRG